MTKRLNSDGRSRTGDRASADGGAMPGVQDGTARRIWRGGTARMAMPIGPTRAGLIAGLLGTTAWLAMPDTAAAQSCGMQGSVYTCTYSGNTYAYNFFYANADAPDAVPMTVTSTGDITMAVQPGQGDTLNFGAFGFSQTNKSGGNTQGLQFTNSGSLTLTAGASWGNNTYGIQATQIAGSGDNGGSSGSLSGSGVPAGITINNSGTIDLELSGIQVGGGAAISGFDSGGNGVSGGSGGSSAGVSITNSGQITVNVSSYAGFAGITAQSVGGDGSTNDAGAGGAVTIDNSGSISATAIGSAGFTGLYAQSLGGNAPSASQSQSNSASGGDAGLVTVTSSAAVDVGFTWSNAASPSEATLFGIYAQSAAGDAGNNQHGSDTGSVGVAGNAGGASITLTQGGDVSVVQSGTPPTAQDDFLGAGVGAFASGGLGGNSAETSSSAVSGTPGGSIAGVGIKITDASVTTSGDGLPALLAVAQGGTGGGGGCAQGPVDGQDCNTVNSRDEGRHQNGGVGGSIGESGIVIQAQNEAVQITTDGDNAPAIVASLTGGDGGDGGGMIYFGEADAGSGGNGGTVTGSGLTVELAGTTQTPITVQTTGADSPAIFAASTGGDGGDGGVAKTTSARSFAGPGGTGGVGSAVTVALISTTVATEGDTSSAIVAQSRGGDGGVGALAIGGSAHGGVGGNGGAAGPVLVTLDSNSRVATQGTQSMGILAQSMSGAGGNANGSSGLGSAGGGGGTGGGGAGVTVQNAGGITTADEEARGIFAQAMAGNGGAGGGANALFSSSGGTGGGAGSPGDVTVTNTGTISTSGEGAQAILAQSIGGTGGAGGSSSGVFYVVGGTGGTDPFTTTGDSVTVNQSAGAISTSGQLAFGILGQSIGGGGGDGGSASGISVAVGGGGGNGGLGGEVVANLTGGSVTTTGDQSAGVVMQSIGGGGGNGGNSTGTGVELTVSLGGTAGSGSDGGTATIYNYGTSIVTSGTKSPGMVVQSIGGGGGTGGGALGYTVGAGFAGSFALGGSGGSGGDGDWAAATVSGASILTGQNALLINGTFAPDGQATTCPQTLPCNILPIDNYGVVVQSIGGGGGLGGSATAKALAVSVPTGDEGNSAAVAASMALGGNGGAGGNGSLAEFSLSDGGTVQTLGQGSTAVLVQSIGGGGGAGGDSSALSVALGYNKLIPDSGTSAVGTTISVSHGGKGGTGGDGGAVNVALGGSVVDSAFNPDNSSLTSTVTTYGDFADGIKAQSIGGGGGDAGTGSSNTQQFGTGTSNNLKMVLGSQGGGAGNGETVIVNLYESSSITTYGSGAIGVVAQSIAGGGGSSQGGSLALSQGSGIDIKLGTQGGGGGTGGTVAVTSDGAISTQGGDATGILAQSIGGGGGLAGSSGSDASADNPVTVATNARKTGSSIAKYVENGGDINPQFNLSIGGAGGSGGSGGVVSVAVNNDVTTLGDWAHGVVAQSIGGGGGKGGTAAATGTASASNVNINLNIAVGGSGGNGGDGGQSTSVELGEGPSGSTLITTGGAGAGFGAAGVVVQNIGGGGGIGADGSDRALGTISLGFSQQGGSGYAGNGNTAELTYSNNAGTQIVTSGALADGVVIQSIGGGGGIGGAGSSAWPGAANGTFDLTVGGGQGANGNGGDVTFAPNGGFIDITTTGYGAYGVLAQSIGGGGGTILAARNGNNAGTYLGGTYSGSGGNGGTVTVNLGSESNITTSGNMAFGIVAQSIGGGGGAIRVAGYTTDVANMLVGAGNTTSTYPTEGSGNTVTVETAGTITANGPASIAIFAQSVGGGGGLINNGVSLYAGAPLYDKCDSKCDAGGGGAVEVTVESGGNAYATGENGIGIFAQSAGPKTSAVTVNVSGNVQGGTGSSSAGVWIDSGSDNQVNIESGGNVYTAGGGNAVTTTGGGSTKVNNAGDVMGSVLLNGGTMANAATGVFAAGAVMGGDLANHGLVALGRVNDRATQVTRVDGDFTQSASGRLEVLFDPLNRAANRLDVNGTATLDGEIAVVARSLVRDRELAIVRAGQSLTGALTAVDTRAIDFEARTAAGEARVAAIDSRFAAAFDSLSRNEERLGEHLDAIFDNRSTRYAGLLAALNEIGVADDTGVAYARALAALSPGASQAMAAAQPALARGRLD
ncbi:beta strand repeat-containing protein, partial [Mesorhizobium sp. IMUNJ 23232]|uniref:beta strand repeat-containing protein n=1 Tax=Mesorhizobium sp. IMUNJ 23232 TaxID=3376064 RepID=UPI0037B06E14